MIYSIQFLRFFACILVLYAHIPPEVFGGVSAQYRGNIGVDIFFVISGFVMYMSTTKLDGGVKTSLSFLLRRINRIWPMYFIFTLIFAFEIAQIEYYKQHLRLGSIPELITMIDWVRIFSSLSMFPLANSDGIYTDPFLAIGWTLSFELYFYFIISILLILKIRSALAPLLIIIIAATISLVDANWSPFFSMITSPILLEFAFGYFLAYGYQNHPSFFERYSLAIIPSAIFLFFMGMQGVDSGWYRNFARMTVAYSDGLNMHRLFAYGVPSFLLCAAVLSMEKKLSSSNMGVSISRKLGDITYALYLSHLPIIVALVTLGVETNGAERLIFIFLPILAASIIYEFFEAPVLKRTNKTLHNFVNAMFSARFSRTLPHLRGSGSKVTDLVICLLVVLSLCTLIGPDVWAETQAEYLDCIKSIESLFSKGWFGYWALAPKLSAYIYNLILFDATSPGIYARIITSIIVFVSMFISLRMIECNWLKLLFSLSLTSTLLHQSSFTLTNCSYILLLPLLIFQIKAAVSSEKIENYLTSSKALYLIALLSKATFIFLVLPLTFLKNWKFLLVAFSIGGWQLYAMNNAAGSGLNLDMFSTVNAILRMFYIFVSSVGAVFDFSFFGSSLYKYTSLNSGIYFFIGLCVSAVLLIPVAIELGAKNLRSLNFIKLLAPPAIIFISILPFVVWILVFGNGIRYLDKELFAVIFTNSKLQYFVISTPILALSLVFALGKVLQPKYLNFIIMLFCAGSFLTIKNQYTASRMAHVDSKLTFFEEFKELPYYKCFAIPPFASDAVLEGFTLNGQFLLGGCKQFSMHNKYENGIFSAENTTYDFSQKVGGVFTYLGVVSRVVEGEKMQPSIRFWDSRCMEIGKSIKVSQWTDNDNLFYVAGLIADDRLTPLEVNELLPYCFGVNTEKSPTSTILLMLPEKK